VTTLVSIDPGTEETGIALYRAGALVDVDVLRVKRSVGNREQRASVMGRLAVDKVRAWCGLSGGGTSVRVVLEYPQVYRHGPGAEVDPDDVLCLVLVLGHLWGTFHGVNGNALELVRPATWKGQVPKRVMNNRIIATLTKTEQQLVHDKVRSNHNAIDAVGIGVWALRRPWGVSPGSAS
jgi:hypothetical protein